MFEKKFVDDDSFDDIIDTITFSTESTDVENSSSYYNSNNRFVDLDDDAIELHMIEKSKEDGKILDIDDYGLCETVLGWGWTSETCELISGCGMGDDEPWFYDTEEICTTRCIYIEGKGCMDENACNYGEEDECWYPEDNDWCDCDGKSNRYGGPTVGSVAAARCSVMWRHSRYHYPPYARN